MPSKRTPKRKLRPEPSATARLLDRYIAQKDSERAAVERKTNPLLTVSLCELSEKDVAFVEEPWRTGADDPAFATALRSDASAITRTSVRGQPLLQAMQRLCKRVPIPSVAPFVYDRARAKELSAWLQEQPASKARDTLLSPLRRAVTRKHAFAILFDTV